MVDIDKCQITHYPADVLGKKAEPVGEINNNIKQLVEKMYEIMHQNRGVGLAAPQAGVSLRLFIISLDGSRESVKVFINPTVTPYGTLDTIEEGYPPRFADTNMRKSLRQVSTARNSPKKAKDYMPGRSSTSTTISKERLS